ncbi:Chorismate pyruvate-lyase [Commensalibacter sp. Nvir]|uniref:chorismate--pyruvate lyase family protein n=1 Tax=Commensalibacter sp. Nvir TaxID=3069817 RepID=UPI002D658BF0|nr:Chorismate pyruvate-lyase [Commensalibacter sp. Nvir]
MVSLKWSETLLQQSEVTSQQNWLTDRASLTKRLIELSNNHFSVELIREGWSIIRPDECQQLEGSSSERYWLREVFLTGQTTRWVYARTVANSFSATHAHCDLTQLGNKSLGNCMFTGDHFTRTPFSYGVYPKNLLTMLNLSNDLVARRSCFVKDAICLLVQEVFLPEFWAAIDKTTKSS